MAEARASLDVARHRRALELCDTASELPADDRAAYLHAHTDDDPALRRLSLDLLARMVEEDGDVRVGEPAVGAQFAGYRIVRPLGEGGMGAVYLAQRDDAGVVREVALKTLQRIRPSAGDIARFRAEQQALAQLHHPFVASLVDVGVADDGAPWFAMEFVPGSELTVWCDARQATHAERIALWEKVCDAVAYAHRNLVVHRDIKPANILVTEDGLPKLLDFGVAKLLEGGGTEATAAFARHLTIDYATPERILRDEVSTADDIYALGVLLFELLCGTRPFARGDFALEQLFAHIRREVAPTLPEAFARASERERSAIAAARRVSVRQLRVALQGDIAAVLAKCLHADAARRYRTVEQLVDDVRRCARGLPVAARGDGMGYRLRRFVGRHRLGLAAASVSVLALVGALAVSVAQTRYAADQARRATAVSGFLQEVLAAPSSRWDTRWRGTPDVSMVDVLHLASRNLDVELRDQPDVRIELYASLARAFAAVNRNADAVAEQRKAVRLAYAALPEDSPVRPQSRLDLATMLDYLRTPDALREARAHIAEGLAWHDRFAPGPSPGRAALLGEIGVNATMEGRHRDGAVLFQRAIDVFHASGAPPTHPLLGVGYGLMGLAWVDAHELARARPALIRGVEIQTRHSGGPTVDALFPLGALAYIELSAGRDAEARRHAAIALDYVRRIQGWRSPTAVMVLLGNALVRRETGDVATAQRLFLEADAIAATVRDLPPQGRDAVTLARAEYLVAAGRASDALGELDRVAHMATDEKLRGVSYDHRGRYLVTRARAFAALDRPGEAAPLMRAAYDWRSPILGRASTMQRRLAVEIAALSP